MELTQDAQHAPPERLAKRQGRPCNADRRLQVFETSTLAAKATIQQAKGALALYKPAHVCTLLPWPEKDALVPAVLCSIYYQVEAAQLPCILHQVRHCIVDLVCLRSQHSIMRGASRIPRQLDTSCEWHNKIFQRLAFKSL